MCFGDRFCASMQKGCDMGWWVCGCGSPGDSTTGGCGPQVTTQQVGVVPQVATQQVGVVPHVITQQVGVVLGCERSWSAHLISRRKREGGKNGGRGREGKEEGGRGREGKERVREGKGGKTRKGKTPWSCMLLFHALELIWFLDGIKPTPHRLFPHCHPCSFSQF